MAPTVIISALLGAWLGAELEPRESCVALRHVWPRGPAAAAGLKPGDCIHALASPAAHTPSAVLEAIIQAPEGASLKLSLGGDQSRTLVVMKPSDREKRGYCEWLQASRIRLTVTNYTAEGRSQRVIEYERDARAQPVSVATLRRLVGATLPATVAEVSSCGDRPRRMRDNAPDTMVLTSDAHVDFGLRDEPAGTWIYLRDGGSCQAPPPAIRPDGGLDPSMIPGDCSRPSRPASANRRVDG